MKRLYQETFSQIHLRPETAERLRRRLQEGPSQKEGHPMKRKLNKGLVAAAAAVLSLSCVAAATVASQRTLLNGDLLTTYPEGDGSCVIEQVTYEDASAVTAEDGRLYVTLNGEKQDITDQRSETEYFAYDDKEHNESLVVGGTPEAYGVLDIVWDSNGFASVSEQITRGGSSNQTGDDWAEWYKKAYAHYGLDLGSYSDAQKAYGQQTGQADVGSDTVISYEKTGE